MCLFGWSAIAKIDRGRHYSMFPRDSIIVPQHSPRSTTEMRSAHMMTVSVAERDVAPGHVTPSS